MKKSDYVLFVWEVFKIRMVGVLNGFLLVVGFEVLGWVLEVCIIVRSEFFLFFFSSSGLVWLLFLVSFGVIMRKVLVLSLLACFLEVEFAMDFWWFYWKRRFLRSPFFNPTVILRVEFFSTSWIIVLFLKRP